MKAADGTIEFYVNDQHAVGGVTVWSDALVTYLQGRSATGVISVAKATDPGEAAPIHKLNGARVVRSTNNPVSRDSGNVHYWTGRPIALPPREQFRSSLDQSERSALVRTAVYIPNYIEFGYKLSAFSRLEGHDSRCIGVCHTDEPHYYRLLHKYEPVIQKFVAVSRRTQRHLIEAIPHRAADVHLVPYGVRCPPSYPHRTRTGLAIRILYAGRLVSRQKRVFDFVHLVEDLERRGVDFSFDLIGTGPDEAVLTRELRAVSNRARVMRPRPHQQMLDLYHRYDVFAMVSSTEGTSIAMLEAMSHGVVPIVTEVSGSEDVIEHGVNGFLGPVGTPSALAGHIARLAQGRAELEELSYAAWHTAVREYQFDRRAEEFIQVIEVAQRAPLASTEAARHVLS